MHLRFRTGIATLLFVLISALLTGPALAAVRYKMISTAELKKWLESTAPPTLVYSLSQVEFEEQRLPGSVCIPMELMASSSELPSDKNQPLVFYCKGPG